MPLYEFPMAYISSVAVETLRTKLSSERAKTIRLRDENDKFKAVKSARASEQPLKDATSKILELCAKIDKQGRLIQALEAKLDRERNRKYFLVSAESRYWRRYQEIRDGKENLVPVLPLRSSLMALADLFRAPRGSNKLILWDV